jgi:hypothetical protein
MFTWICPQCKREVAPHLTECPWCAANPAATEPVQPPAQAPSGPAAPPPPVHAVRRPSSGIPTWLLTIVFVLAFVGLGAGIYWALGYFRGGSQAAAPPATVESPAAKPGAKTNPLQKYVEVSGIRFTEDDKKRIVVKFVVTNHSDADLAGLAGNVTVWARTQKSEEDAVGTFSFKASPGPLASQEASAPLTTKLKVYELPDWQNVTSDLQITAPQ